MVSRTFPIVACFVLNLFLSGCVSTKEGPSIVVGNATENLISMAVVKSGDTSYTFEQVTALSASAAKQLTAALAGEVVVEWESDSGVKRSKTIKLGKELMDFAGSIQFQIGEDDAVKVFTAAGKEAGASELPWSMPASWEGAPSIPGMNM